jgi:hypothetical protein
VSAPDLGEMGSFGESMWAAGVEWAASPGGEEHPICGDPFHRHTGPCEIYAPEPAAGGEKREARERDQLQLGALRILLPRLREALQEAVTILEDVAAKGEIRNHATGRRELTPPVSDTTRFAAESWLAAHEPLPVAAPPIGERPTDAV